MLGGVGGRRRNGNQDVCERAYPSVGWQGAGTVCAASSDQVARSLNAEPLLMLLSGLPSYSLERELLVERLHSVNAELAKLALADSLTRLSQ